MLKRIAIAYIPFALASIGIYSTNYWWLVTYLLPMLTGVYAAIHMALVCKLYSIRHELHDKYLDETKTLVIYAWLCLVEVIFSGITFNFYSDAFPVKEYLWMLVLYLYGELILVSLMWLFSIGRVLYRIQRKKNLTEDLKPPTTTHSLTAENGTQIINSESTSFQNEKITPSSSTSHLTTSAIIITSEMRDSLTITTAPATPLAPPLEICPPTPPPSPGLRLHLLSSPSPQPSPPPSPIPTPATLLLPVHHPLPHSTSAIPTSVHKPAPSRPTSISSPPLYSPPPSSLPPSQPHHSPLKVQSPLILSICTAIGTKSQGVLGSIKGSAVNKFV